MRKLGRLALVRVLGREVWEESKGVRERGGNTLGLTLHARGRASSRRIAPLLGIIHIGT
jgi:hypothetical protein